MMMNLVKRTIVDVMVIFVIWTITVIGVELMQDKPLLCIGVIFMGVIISMPAFAKGCAEVNKWLKEED